MNKEYFEEHHAALDNLIKYDISEIVDLIRNTTLQGGTIWTAGNGGSASTASHAQCDLSKGLFLKTELKNRVICLTDLAPTLSAWENDFGHNLAIANMCENFVNQNDLLILISGSGNSANVVEAARWANQNQVKVCSMTGFDGGTLKTLSSFNYNVDSNDMQVIENMHLVFIHYLLKEL